MRVDGEAFFLINGWMNFLSLLMAARLARARFRAGRALLSALAGALYAMAAWGIFPWLRKMPVLGATALIMARIAFQGRAARLSPLLLAAEMTLSGLSDFLLTRGVPATETLLLCGAAALLFIRLMGGASAPGHRLKARLIYRGRDVLLPAIRDSGNLLRDAVTGLPVIVAPTEGVRPLLPPGADTEKMLSLPRGFRLLRVRTAAGEKLMPCFHPDQVILCFGSKEWEADAVVALSPGGLSRALVPETMLQTEGGSIHASF